MILWQDLLRKTLVPPLMPARGALVVACLTGLVTLTSTRIYDLHYSTYTRVPGSVSIHILHTVVLDYGELLAYWFISQAAATTATAADALPPLPLRCQRHCCAARRLHAAAALPPLLCQCYHRTAAANTALQTQLCVSCVIFKTGKSC
jgi:hypothetical protein